MTQDRIDKTRDKMRRGGLPPATREGPSTRAGLGHRCDGCDEMIDLAETQYDVTVAGVVSLRFHDVCYTTWANFRR